MKQIHAPACALFILSLAQPCSSWAQQCPDTTARGDLTAGPAWSGWGVDIQNSRFQPAKDAGLSPDQVPRLKLKWAFGIPGAKAVIGQPVIAGGRVYISGDNSKIYSLDAATGCLYWSFTAQADTRNSPTIGPAPGRPGRSSLYFGDMRGNLYAVDAANGELLWKTSADPHPKKRITASPKLYEGRLYIGVSSFEEVGSADPDYPCCTFRGSVIALDAATGKQIWKTFIIPEAAKPTRKNSKGTQLWGPAGGGVWNSPTIDVKRHALYVGTGDAYTDPAPKNTDAVMALDLKTGRILWSVQDLGSDAWIVGCGAAPRPENCPKDLGPDYDFGASPILRDLPNGHSVLIAAQKSGMVWAHDPDHKGAVLWKMQTAEKDPPATGQLVWGGAADDQNAFFGLASGGVVALSLAAGERKWYAPLDTPSGRKRGHESALSLIPGVAFSDGWDGHIRALSTSDGRIMWDYDTVQPFKTVNGVEAKGGSMGGPGPVVAGGMLLVGSGFIGVQSGLPGNVLLAFTPQ
jgi:polyvinyl alcohol dehydrogenase (cytochrome)